jgi:hypothetical protein
MLSFDSDVDNYIMTEKLLGSIFQHAMGTRIAIPEILLNTWGFSSVRLSTQGVT